MLSHMPIEEDEREEFICPKVGEALLFCPGSPVRLCYYYVVVKVDNDVLVLC